MMIRFKAFGRMNVIYSRRVTWVEGINSTLKNNHSILMIDCDDINMYHLKNECKRLIEKYKLPRIDIFSTGRKDSYHLYCWCSRTFRECILIAMDCYYTDKKFIQFSLGRGHFTLRISKKNHRPISYVTSVESSIDNESIMYDLQSTTSYMTASRVYSHNG